MSLIVIRKIFKDIPLVDLNANWLTNTNNLQLIYDLLGVLIIFFLIFTPMGMILKLFGVDLLLENRKQNLDSFWIKRSKPPESMDKQF